MKVLIIMAYYKPERVSSLDLFVDLFEYWSSQGIEIELLTPSPCRGLKKEEIKNQSKIRKEIKNNGKFIIHRMRMFKEGKNPIFRAIRYILCNFLFIVKSLCIPADLIFVQSTPPTQGLMGVMIKKIKKIPLVYNIQDIFPDSLVSTGLVNKKGRLYNIGLKIEKNTYRNADKIITISESMKENLLKKGVDDTKIEVIYNWTNLNDIHYIDDKRNIIFDKYDISRENFNIVYAGNIGEAQDIEALLRVAQELKEYKEINFLIFGEGSKKEKYLEYVEDKKINNVKFFPLLEKKYVKYVYNLGEINILTCKKGFGSIAMPSKFPVLLASSRTVLAYFDKETDIERIIQNNNCGIFVSSGDSKSLKDSILKLYMDNELRKTLGRNGREVALKYFSEKNMNLYSKVLLNL